LWFRSATRYGNLLFAIDDSFLRNKYVILNKRIYTCQMDCERGIIMEELAKQVKFEMLRTVVWLVVALGIGIAAYYLIW